MTQCIGKPSHTRIMQTKTSVIPKLVSRFFSVSEHNPTAFTSPSWGLFFGEYLDQIIKKFSLSHQDLRNEQF